MLTNDGKEKAMFDKCASDKKECTNRHCYCRCFGCALFAVALILIVGFVVQLIWNALIPGIFTLGTISYVQALGLLILARLLFGSMGHRHSYHGHRHGGWCGWTRKSTSECGDWKHYEDWWHEEGRESFKKYAAGKKENKDAPIL